MLSPANTGIYPQHIDTLVSDKRQTKYYVSGRGKPLFVCINQIKATRNCIIGAIVPLSHAMLILPKTIYLCSRRIE